MFVLFKHRTSVVSDVSNERHDVNVFEKWCAPRGRDTESIAMARRQLGLSRAQMTDQPGHLNGTRSSTLEELEPHKHREAMIHVQ